MLGPQFHGNQDYVTIKFIARRTFVLARLQLIDECYDEKIPFKYLALVIIDVVNNTSGLKLKQIENLLLEKEKFSIGTLVTQHQSLNSTHDWNCSKRTEREKINN